jgi:hypothetical protein
MFERRGEMVMRAARLTALFLTQLLCASAALSGERSPALASSDSPWNVLAMGGKGEMRGTPICRPLAYFSKSPLPLDFDADFYGEREAGLVTHATVTLLGTIGDQRVYEVKQTVVRKGQQNGLADAETPPTMKVLLVERGPNEFCDIYQNQYTYDPTHETDETAILDIDGKKVLKTFETDRHTWYLEYWTIQNREPLHLSPADIYTAIRSVSPVGALPFSGPLNVTGSRFTVDIFEESSDQKLLGKVDLQIELQGNKIVARSKTWVPSD